MKSSFLRGHSLFTEELDNGSDFKFIHFANEHILLS